MKRKTKPKAPAANPLAPANCYPAHGSDLGELLLIAAAVEGHVASILTVCQHLHACVQKLDAMRARIRDGKGG